MLEEGVEEELVGERRVGGEGGEVGGGDGEWREEEVFLGGREREGVRDVAARRAACGATAGRGSACSRAARRRVA